MAKEEARPFLLEVGTEPMPARFIAPALKQLEEGLKARLTGRNVTFATAPTTFGTLRRLAILFTDLEAKSSPSASQEFGPPARLLKDEKGQYTKQAEGFARKYNTTPERLTTVPTLKGEVLAVTITEPSRPTLQILSEVIPEVLAAIEFPKSLTWEESGFRFGRPIRTLTALFGSRVVPFKVAGVASGKKVSGLPFHGKPVTLDDPLKYRDTLRDLLVLADVEERRSALLKSLEQAAGAAGGARDDDEELLTETVFMTEHPVPVEGSFDVRFLSLPPQLLALVLKKQLKFFPLSGADGLLAVFLGVRDGVSEGQAQVREGYERVLTARLSDAAFFVERDRRVPLAAKLPFLDRITYQKSLGSMSAKALRVAKLSKWMCAALEKDERPVNETAVAEIARLAYADLVTEVVKEFPELQGLMGGFYARQDGLDERVALGLEQFYLPSASRGPLPATDEGALVSLAGKLDSLCGSFAAGIVPTGSADPYGLRRQATGILRILIEKQLPIDLDLAVRHALDMQPQGLLKQGDIGRLTPEILEFIWVRAQSLFEELGYRVDEVRSVKAGAFASLPRTYLRLAAIHAVRKNPEFEPLAAAFKRASNILRQAKNPDSAVAAVDRGILREPSELALFDSLVLLEGQLHDKLAVGEFEAGLRALVCLKPQLDSFFEGVMVMAEDPSLRAQRLALLSHLVRLFKTVADLSEIQSPA